MAIATTDFNLYPATSQDGGRRLGLSTVARSAVGSVIPRITAAEYAAGYDRTYKLFVVNENDADETAYDCFLILDKPTAGDDWGVIYAGTARDDASDHSSPTLYGAAYLSSDYTAGDPTIEVEVEDVSLVGLFADGQTFFVVDKATQESGTGNREKAVVSGSPSVSDTTLTITLATTLANSYAVVDGARACSAIDVGDLACSVDNWAESFSGTGSYDETGFPVVLDNQGVIEQTWTIEFTSATEFTCTGDTLGTLSLVGDVSVDYAPINPINGKPYFTLLAGGHGGTAAALDTIVMQTHAAESGFYLELIGPASGTQTASSLAPYIIYES